MNDRWWKDGPSLNFHSKWNLQFPLEFYVQDRARFSCRVVYNCWAGHRTGVVDWTVPEMHVTTLYRLRNCAHVHNWDRITWFLFQPRVCFCFGRERYLEASCLHLSLEEANYIPFALIDHPFQSQWVLWRLPLQRYFQNAGRSSQAMAM